MNQFLQTAKNILYPQVITTTLGINAHKQKSVIACLGSIEFPQIIFYNLQREGITKIEDLIGKNPRKILGCHYNEPDIYNRFENWLEGFCLSIDYCYKYPPAIQTRPEQKSHPFASLLRALHRHPRG